MHCNKVKKGKRCITYILQLNLIKLNPDRSGSLSVRRIFQSSMVKTLHECALPRSELEYVDRMTHCGMVPNGVAHSIEFQLMSLRDWSISM